MAFVYRGFGCLTAGIRVSTKGRGINEYTLKYYTYEYTKCLLHLLKPYPEPMLLYEAARIDVHISAYP